jgi:hypothetical protein
MIFHLPASYRRRPINRRQSQGIHLIHSFRFRSRQLSHPGPGSPVIAVASTRLSLVGVRRVSDNVPLIRGCLPHRHDAFSDLKAFHARYNPVRPVRVGLDKVEI